MPKDPRPLRVPFAVVPPAPQRSSNWSSWSPGLATTVAALTSLGLSAACALWSSDNSTAALTYGALACMTGAVLVTHKVQTAFTTVNDSTQRTLEAASDVAARTAAEVLPQLTQTLVQAAAQTSHDVAQNLEGLTEQVHHTLGTATQSVTATLRQVGKTVGVLLGTAAALYVLGRLGAPLILAAGAGQGVLALAGLLGAWSMAMVAVGWWAPRALL